MKNRTGKKNEMDAVAWAMATIIIFAFSFLIAAMCLGSANAADFEVAIGESKFNSQPNGVWYQNGFAHTLDLTSQSFDGIVRTEGDENGY